MATGTTISDARTIWELVEPAGPGHAGPLMLIDATDRR